MNLSVFNFELAPRMTISKEDNTVNLTLGVGSYLSEAVTVGGHILVGNYCSLAHAITFNIGLNHPLDFVTAYPFYAINDQQQFYWSALFDYYKRKYNHNQIIIGNDVWIGEGVTIMGGVKIGNGAIIGAKSVVAKDVPPYAVAVGNPVSVVKYRFSDEIIEILQTIKWWYWPDKKIRENYELMKTPAAFCEAHYAAAKEQNKIKDFDLTAGLKNSRTSGNKLYYIFADSYRVTDEQLVWKDVVDSFIAECNAESPKILIIELPDNGFSESDWDYLRNKSTENKEAAPRIYTHNNKDEIPAILANIDVFITTREGNSSYGVDYAADFGAKIVSGLDWGIFDDND